MTALHALIGYIFKDQLITSPNARWMPAFQHWDCSVQLHKDMRFGQDDYILWPQWFQDNYPYLAAIPKPPAPGKPSPFARMWYSATHADFTLADQSAPGRNPGYVHKRFEAELTELHNDLSATVRTIVTALNDAPDGTNVNNWLGGLATCERHAWLSLTTYAATFDEKRLELVEYQRAWLELKGLTNYYVWNRDRVQSATRSTVTVVEDCIGCLVKNPVVAMQLFDMGVPVWLMRNKMAALTSGTYIEYPTDHAVRPSDVDEGFKFSLERDPSFPVVYAGRAKHPMHYHYQHQFSRIRTVIQRVSSSNDIVSRDVPHMLKNRKDAATILVSLNTLRIQEAAGESQAQSSARPAAPTMSASSSTSSSASSSASSSLSRRQSRRKNRSHPCKFIILILIDLSSNFTYTDTLVAPKAAPAFKANPNAPAHLFVEADGPNLPFVIPAWQQAIAEIDRKRLEKEHNPPPHVYSFPPAKVITGMNAERCARAMTSWLHIRHNWLGQARSRPIGTEVALRQQTWRDLLQFGMGGPNARSPSEENMSKIQQDLAQFSMYVNNDGTTLTFDNGEQLHAEALRPAGFPSLDNVWWQGGRYCFTEEEVPGYVTREILWELQELNFRYDLIMLDNFLTEEPVDDTDPHTVLPRQERLMKCFGAVHHDFYSPSDIDMPATNSGLATDSIKGRFPFVRALYDLTLTWKNFRRFPSSRNILGEISQNQALGIELDMYRAVQQGFYDLFARPMVPPRRLYQAR